ncbi:MAG: phosphotransferase family protein [Bacilli bacterium]|nr:phosphotransferase family protein [Bacilli bacterium]
MNDATVLQKLELMFPDKKVEILYRLMGGMSNYTYVVQIGSNKYTYRIPGEYSEHFVNRQVEIENIKILEPLGITNKTVYFSVETGEKLALFVEGTSLNQLQGEFPYQEVSELLKVIHESGKVATNDYDPFGRLSTYENHIKELGYVHPEAYHQTKKHFLSYKPFLDRTPKVLCHGDSQPSNFVFHEGKLMTVDFEFCGNNDPLYDIACFANMKLEHGEKLLNTYFLSPTKEEKMRFYLWRAFQCLQWYNVAIFKEMKGMSITLHIDFKMVAEKYLEKAQALLEIVAKI